MYRHLIAIEVGIKGGTGEWVQLNGAAFDQHSLKGLDTQPVEGRRTVQEHGMIFNHLFQHIPPLWLDTLHKAFRALNIMREVLLHQLTHHKWLEELQCHLLGQATLVQLEVRAYYNHRTTRVVNTLTKQVLPETPLLPPNHIRHHLH